MTFPLPTWVGFRQMVIPFNLQQRLAGGRQGQTLKNIGSDWLSGAFKKVAVTNMEPYREASDGERVGQLSASQQKFKMGMSATTQSAQKKTRGKTVFKTTQNDELENKELEK